MDVLILVVVLVAAAVYVAQPLYSSADGSADPSDRGSLQARREALIQLLRDLDQDRRSGLLEEAEYSRQREAAESETAAVLRALEPGRGSEPGAESD